MLNDIGPEIDDTGVERIKTYVGKGIRFNSWDQAAEVVAANNAHAFDGYTHDDWLRMAQRNCREYNGEIVFDYVMRAGPVTRSNALALMRAVGLDVPEQ